MKPELKNLVLNHPYKVQYKNVLILLSIKPEYVAYPVDCIYMFTLRTCSAKGFGELVSLILSLWSSSAEAINLFSSGKPITNT